ncbi:MAG: hypothetical protein RR929_00115 [Erysipelotrichaceae bacterium]
MFNKEEVLQIIKDNKAVYFTSEQGVAAERNALDSLSNITKLENPVAKELGIYDGEDFETEYYDVYDGDSIYILVEAY